MSPYFEDFEISWSCFPMVSVEIFVRRLSLCDARVLRNQVYFVYWRVWLLNLVLILLLNWLSEDFFRSFRIVVIVFSDFSILVIGADNWVGALHFMDWICHIFVEIFGDWPTLTLTNLGWCSSFRSRLFNTDCHHIIWYQYLVAGGKFAIME